MPPKKTPSKKTICASTKVTRSKVMKKAKELEAGGTSPKASLKEAWKLAKEGKL